MLAITIITAGLLVCALLLSMAQFASKAVGGDDVLNAMRLLRMGGWTIALVWVLDRCLESGPGLHPMHLVVGLLAFTDVVAGLRRFRLILQDENERLKYGRPIGSPSNK